MTEELRLKLRVDTSEIKKSVKEINKDIAKIDNPLTGATLAKSATTTKKSMEQLKDSIEQLRNFSVLDMIVDNLDKISKSAKSAGANWKSAGRHIKEAVGSIALGFNSQHWKELGYDNTLSENLKNIKWGFSDAKESIVSGIAHINAAWHDMGNVVDAVIPPMLRKIALLVGAIVGVVGVIRSAMNTSLLAKQMNVLAQQAGMSVDAYQRWAFVLSQTGLEVDDMIGAQQTLLEAQVDVREGTEDIIKAFEKIGLSQSEVLGMNQQQLFEKTVEGLQNVENQTERATLAFKLLSEDSKNLAPLLNLTSEEVAVLANNYNLLGASMNERLIQSSNRLQASLGNMRAAWQGLKNTLAEAILPVVITVVNWLTRAIAVVNMFLRAVFGLEIGSSSGSAMDKAAQGVGAYTESVETATGAVEKLKRTTMGFDELNIVSNPNSGSGAGAGSAPGALGGGFGAGVTDSLFSADALEGLDKMQAWVDKYKERIQDVATYGLIALGIGLAVIGALHGNIPMIIAGVTLAGLGIAIGNVEDGSFDRLVENYGATIKGVIAPALIGIGATLAVIGGLTGNLPLLLAGASMAGLGLGMAALGNKDGFKGYVDNLKSMLPDIINWAMIALGAAGAVMCGLTGNWVGALAFAGMAGIGLYNVATGGNFWEDAAKVVKKAWDGVKNWFVQNVKPIFTKKFWSEKFGTVREGAETKLGEARTAIMNAWNNVRAYWNTNIAPKFTLAYWKEKFDTMRSALQTKLGELRNQVINSWNSIKTYWNTNIAPKFTLAYWKQKFDTMRAAMSEKINAVRTTVMNGWNTVKSWFNNTVAPKFTVTYWKNKFDTVKNGIKASFNGIISIVELAVNRIINKINTLSWSIPTWVPSVGGKKFGFNFKNITIPRLATGGIAVSSTLANIGENGKEAVLPLENNTGWMDMLADKIASRNNTPTRIVLQLDGRELGYATINSINGITDATGRLLLHV